MPLFHQFFFNKYIVQKIFLKAIFTVNALFYRLDSGLYRESDFRPIMLAYKLIIIRLLIRHDERGNKGAVKFC